MVADTLNAVFICAWIYRVLINNFGESSYSAMCRLH